MDKFFEKAFKELKSSKKILTAVLTDIDSEEISENLIGEMFLFNEEEIIEFSSEKMELELEKFFLNENFKNQFLTTAKKKKNDPQLKKINISEAEKTEFFLEAVTDQPRLTIFGAGHIAEELVKICTLLDFRITVVDDREDFLNYDRFPGADQIFVIPYNEYFANARIKADDYMVILTRGHHYDYDVLKNIINSEARYIGMIGSRKKIESVYNKLKAAGISKKQLKRVNAPIGLNLGSETPAEIAVAIAAELIAVRRGN